ncbi:MAG TPA: LuxR C-terminal-related transcriptional regulator [Candidatus Sulfotelmatobacter sp.]|nr:LuxR C-terminal-related transcriptional regulator [Candidatus Sulfotelmatobacter sp.]
MTPQVGLAILNLELKPVFCNAEAYRIVTYPGNARPQRALEQLAIQEIQAIAKQTAKDSTHAYLSGRRTYLVRMISSGKQAAGVSASLLNGNTPSAVLLMERPSNSKVERIDEISRQYDLTEREREAISLLCQGLTSKQIAEQMNISPNTVKVFLRLVMLKMNVSTRSAIVGKLVDTSVSVNP